MVTAMVMATATVSANVTAGSNSMAIVVTVTAMAVMVAGSLALQISSRYGKWTTKLNMYSAARSMV